MKTYRAELKEAHKTAPPKPDKCDCCGKVTDKLYLDHKHGTTQSRGWVCQNCNLGFSYFNEDPAHFAKAIVYLSTTAA